MTVQVTRDCAVSYNYGVHQLAAGEQIPAGEFAAYLLATGAPVVEVETAAGGADVDGDGVPDGTVKDVLGWVSDEPARAAAALSAELQREKPRKGLVDALQKLTPPVDTISADTVGTDPTGVDADTGTAPASTDAAGETGPATGPADTDAGDDAGTDSPTPDA